jgi:23S rRNA (cytidine1920-2'-O)/16S rRNA (cytidine1409-2'-O)-methyltransferase
MRIDALIFERGLAESRERAKAYVMAGLVYIGGRRVDKPGEQVPADAEPEVRGGMKYVSRGGFKLEKALVEFGVTVENLVCADIGASTGGFTDCMLKRGAAKVYAVDVGYGQLAWSLRTDPRVVTLERVNARTMPPETLGEAVDFVTADVSFISLRLILPTVRRILKPGGLCVCLVKPQFEAGRGRVGKNGVVRDAETHIDVLRSFTGGAEENGFFVTGLTFSPIRGPEGNIEFLGKLGFAPGASEVSAESVVNAAHSAFEGETV